MLGSGPLHQDFAWFLNNIDVPSEVDVVIEPIGGGSFRLKRSRAAGDARDGLPGVAQPDSAVEPQSRQPRR